jgi:hypothetical protein
MNTFWLKVAGLVVLAVVGIVLVSVLTSGTADTEPEKPAKTFYDQAEEDKERFLAEPQALDALGPPAGAKPEQTKAETQSLESTPKGSEPAEPSKPTVLYFKPLSEIDTIEAERLLGVAVPGRSIGRLPMTGYNLMVENCRQIIRRWPESWYAFRAKQLLADLPERYQTRYRITKQELDVSRYAESRPGTQPFKVEQSR